MTLVKDVRFSEAYTIASNVWSVFFDDQADDNFDPMSLLDKRLDSIEYFLKKPRRKTLLHLFIEDYVEAGYDALEVHRYDMLDLILLEYVAVLGLYGVCFQHRNLPADDSPDYEQRALKYIAYLRSKIPIDRIANDAFQLLFRDRRFLLKFNEKTSQHFQKKVSRTHLPAWLKRGVFYRDNGRCVSCLTDLTGSLVTGSVIHIDHILPLAKGGTNDPTNFQLMCSKCNESKHVDISTSDMHPVFW